MTDELVTTASGSYPANMRRIGLAMLPFTPVSFDGPESLYAWTRLIVYGAAASLMWKRQRAIAYVLTGAAGMSLVTSLSGSAWNRGRYERSKQ